MAQLITNAAPPKEYDPKFDQDIRHELERSILREQDPIQRTLGMYELEKPSVGPHERDANRARYMGEFGGLLIYTARVVQDRVGTDFMTNQPTYREREIFLE